MTDNFDGLRPLEDIFAVIKRNRKEVIQIARDDYKGRNLVSLRIWYYDDDGQLRPTPKGLSINANQLDLVIDGLTAARLKMTGRGALLP